MAFLIDPYPAMCNEYALMAHTNHCAGINLLEVRSTARFR